MKHTWMHFYFGTRIYQYLAASTGTLCILSAEMHFGWSSPSLPILIKGTYKFQITSEEASWLAVTLLVGTIVGAIFTGCFADILGRKKIILLTSLPLILGWILIGLADSIIVLYTARFIAGMSNGIAISIMPIYLGEIAEPEVRGMLASLCPVCVVFGILLINILGNYLTIDQTAFISSIFPITLFLTFMWMPESPSFLLLKQRKEDAKRTLEILRGKENAEIEIKRMDEALKNKNKKNSILDLFLNATNRKACVVAFGLRTIQQFCGTTAITFYCKTIFEQADDLISPNIGTIIYFLLQLILAFIASFMVDVCGRKPLMIISLVGSSITLFILSGYIFIKDSTEFDISNVRYLPITSLYLNVAFISIGVRNIPLLMMGEVFSTDIKPIAVCVGTIYFSIIAIATSKLFHITYETIGLYAPFAIFAILGFLGIFFVIFYVPETKGKTLEDIQTKLRGKKHTGEERKK